MKAVIKERLGIDSKPYSYISIEGVDVPNPMLSSVNRSYIELVIPYWQCPEMYDMKPLLQKIADKINRPTYAPPCGC